MSFALALKLTFKHVFFTYIARSRESLSRFLKATTTPTLTLRNLPALGFDSNSPYLMINMYINYNPGHNVLELYNILVEIQFTISKTKLDI